MGLEQRPGSSRIFRDAQAQAPAGSREKGCPGAKQDDDSAGSADLPCPLRCHSGPGDDQHHAGFLGRMRMRLKNRKGAILVLAAFLMAAVLGVLVVVVDFSRIYVQKTELQTAADAAALAGTREIMNGAPDVMVEDSALNYGERNKALSTTVPIARADVICGQWVAATRTYADESANCNPGHNSVTVTTRQTARHSLPGFLGANWQIKATARAYAAYVGAQKCIKPWAIPYPRLTKILDPNNPDSLRNLTEGDIATLRGLPLADRRFMLKIGSPPTSGNFGSLEIPDADPDAPSAGANLYQYNIEECNTDRKSTRLNSS